MAGKSSSFSGYMFSYMFISEHASTVEPIHSWDGQFHSLSLFPSHLDTLSHSIGQQVDNICKRPANSRNPNHWTSVIQHVFAFPLWHSFSVSLSSSSERQCLLHFHLQLLLRSVCHLFGQAWWRRSEWHTHDTHPFPLSLSHHLTFCRLSRTPSPLPCLISYSLLFSLNLCANPYNLLFLPPPPPNQMMKDFRLQLYHEREGRRWLKWIIVSEREKDSQSEFCCRICNWCEYVRIPFSPFFFFFVFFSDLSMLVTRVLLIHNVVTKWTGKLQGRQRGRKWDFKKKEVQCFCKVECSKTAYGGKGNIKLRRSSVGGSKSQHLFGHWTENHLNSLTLVGGKHDKWTLPTDGSLHSLSHLIVSVCRVGELER